MKNEGGRMKDEERACSGLGTNSEEIFANKCLISASLERLFL